MSYIGPAPNPGQNREVDDISSGFNGGTASFTLQVNGQNVSPGSANAIIVSLGGVVQNPGTDYTVSASTITFTTNPASGLSFFGLVLGQGVDTQSVADGSVTAAKLASGAADLVNDTSPQLGGNLDVNTKNIVFGDSAGASDDRLTFGDGTDLSIYHQASNSTSYLLNNSTDLTFMTGGTNVNIKSDTGETLAKFVKNGAVELYYDNSKKVETTSTGIQTVEAVKMTHGGNGVNLKIVHEAGVGNTASTTATVPDCVGGGTVTVTCMHNGNNSITTTKMFPFMAKGNSTAGLGSEIFSINHGSTASFSVSAATLGVTVTNNVGAHAKIRVTFDITANA